MKSLNNSKFQMLKSEEMQSITGGILWWGWKEVEGSKMTIATFQGCAPNSIVCVPQFVISTQYTVEYVNILGKKTSEQKTRPD